RQHFTRGSISKVLAGGGFEVERVCMAGFPFFNLYRLAVISRGDKLADEVSVSNKAGAMSRVAKATMAVFRFLFRFNTLDSLFGWQVVAVARKSGTNSRVRS